MFATIVRTGTVVLVAAGISSGQMTEEAKLVDPVPATWAHFGESVSISGDTAVVGAWFDDHSGLNQAGSAFVFVRNGTSWIQQAHLTASDKAGADYFGSSVGISGDTIVVGARNDDHGTVYDAGSAYVFVRSGAHWSEQAKLIPGDIELADTFGNSVSISGDPVVVGAEGDNHPGAPNAGSAYVFVRNGVSWTEQAKLTASVSELQFGHSVSVSGDTAVVGAWYGGGPGTGSAYVFVRNGTVWGGPTKLPENSPGSDFGLSVGVSGDTVVVGAHMDDESGSSAGAAHVFVRNGVSWVEQAKLIPSDVQPYDVFGVSVSISGDTVAVGAPGDNANVGSAYVFLRSGTNWIEQAKLISSDGESDDSFGNAASISSDLVIVGANLASGEVAEAGAAYTFRVPQGVGTYCTAGTSASGCQAAMSATGAASASAPSGFDVSCAGVEGLKDGAFFYGANGQQALPWGNGSSFKCVVPPLTRTGLLAGSGTAGQCDGSFTRDFNAFWCPTCVAAAKNPGAGAIVQAQLWYRDPQNTSNQESSLSDAIEFLVLP